MVGAFSYRVVILELYAEIIPSESSKQVYTFASTSLPLLEPHSVCLCDWARPPQPTRLCDGGGGDRQHSSADLEPRQRQRQPHRQLPHPDQDPLHRGLAEGQHRYATLEDEFSFYSTRDLIYIIHRACDGAAFKTLPQSPSGRFSYFSFPFSRERL